MNCQCLPVALAGLWLAIRRSSGWRGTPGRRWGDKKRGRVGLALHRRRGHGGLLGGRCWREHQLHRVKAWEHGQLTTSCHWTILQLLRQTLLRVGQFEGIPNYSVQLFSLFVGKPSNQSKLTKTSTVPIVLLEAFNLKSMSPAEPKANLTPCPKYRRT